MPQQRKLDCPICNHPRLTNLSDHLIHSHNISGKERKALLRRAHFQYYLHNQINHKHLYQKQILHLHSLVAVFQKHPHYLSKRNDQTQYHPSAASDQNEDQLIPVLMIVASVMTEFGAPMFQLWTTISSNCTIPSVCWWQVLEVLEKVSL